MSEENIPQKVDPFRFADNALRFKGILSVKNMRRLCESLYQETGDVRVNIEFGKDEQGVPFLKGELSSVLTLQCQRCMEPLPYEMIHKMVLGIAHTEEEAETLPKGYDPIVANDDILIIQDMVEDELIVSLPVVPMHNPKDCKVTLPLILESEPVAQTEKENPFKVIEILRVKRDPE
jgi:uncharacterized protein